MPYRSFFSPRTHTAPLLCLAMACTGLSLRGATDSGSSSSTSSSMPGDGSAIAQVGDTKMSADDVRAIVKSLDANAQAAIQKDPSALSQVVRSILTQKLVLQEAMAKKWDQEPAVAAQLARVRDNAIVESYLLSVARPPDDYPSDAELQAAYDANKAALLVPKQYRLAQIFIKAPKGADAATLSKAQVKLDSVKKLLRKRDADFGAIAKSNSDDPVSASNGGEIGTLPESRMQPEIRSQLGSLAKDSVSEPIRLEDGWHIIKVLDVKDAYTATLPEVRQQLVQQMRNQRAKEISQAYVAKLVQQNPIQVNEMALSKVMKQP